MESLTNTVEPPPDWDQIKSDIFCPLCDYNLRGLIEPRCPECGHRFAWKDLLTPNGLIHPFIFEHHPERNVRSFLATLFRKTRGRAFWQGLRPEHRVRTRRLIVYCLIFTLPVLLPLLAIIANGIYVYFEEPYLNSWQFISPRPLGLDNLMEALRESFRQNLFAPTLFVCTFWAVFPWLNFLTLHVFTQSMRRAKIRSVHVLRAAVYSGEVIFWQAAAWLVLGGLWLLVINRFGAGRTTYYTPYGAFAQQMFEDSGVIALLILALAGLTAIWNAVRLALAYKYYVGFKRSAAVAIATTIIVILAEFAGAVLLEEWSRR